MINNGSDNIFNILGDWCLGVYKGWKILVSVGMFEIGLFYVKCFLNRELIILCILYIY